MAAIWFDCENRLLGCFSVSIRHHTNSATSWSPVPVKLFFFLSWRHQIFGDLLNLSVLLYMYRIKSRKEETDYHFILLSDKAAFTQNKYKLIYFLHTKKELVWAAPTWDNLTESWEVSAYTHHLRAGFSWAWAKKLNIRDCLFNQSINFIGKLC